MEVEYGSASPGEARHCQRGCASWREGHHVRDNFSFTSISPRAAHPTPAPGSASALSRRAEPVGRAWRAACSRTGERDGTEPPGRLERYMRSATSLPARVRGRVAPGTAAAARACSWCGVSARAVLDPSPLPASGRARHANCPLAADPCARAVAARCGRSLPATDRTLVTHDWCPGARSVASTDTPAVRHHRPRAHGQPCGAGADADGRTPTHP